jgi:hypothetical protein
MWMTRPLAAAAGAALAVALLAPAAHAGVYAGDSCISAKLKAAAKKCKADLTAWSTWDKGQDNAKLTEALTKNNTKLSDAWTKAETKAASKGADCTDTTPLASVEASSIDAAVTDIKDTINGTLTLPADGPCGAGRLKAAAKKCQSFLKAESKYIKKLAKDPDGVARDAAQAAASAKFTAAYGAVTGCPANPDAATIEAKVDDLSDGVLSDTTVSPNVPTTWTSYPGDPVTYEGRTLTPICSRDTPYMFWAKRGTGDGANKLLVYYQGGGACWDAVTCAASTGAFDDDVLASDNPGNVTTGLGDLTNPNNPFADWNAVFVSYCTGDVHWGDNKALYLSGPPYGNQTIQHKGYVNAKSVEKFAREHFLIPNEVFVTGSSAGAYGAVLHGILLHEVFPTATFNVVGDAGNGVITQSFLVNNLDQSWHVEQNLPTYIPELDTDITQLTIADLYVAGANHYASRGSRFGQYTAAWDGGPGSQIFFYNVMVNGIGDNGNWWHSACPWNTLMQQYTQDAETGATTGNYRSYVGPGSRHTIYGSNRVYTETHGVPQTFVSWLNDMRSGGPWTSVLCSDCSLLGACDGASPSPGASCQHNAECSPGVCTPIDVRPAPGVNPPNPFLADGFVSCPP